MLNCMPVKVTLLFFFFLGAALFVITAGAVEQPTSIEIDITNSNSVLANTDSPKFVVLTLGLGLVSDELNLDANPSLIGRLDYQDRRQAFTFQYTGYQSESIFSQARDSLALCFLTFGLYCGYVNDNYVTTNDYALMYGIRRTKSGHKGSAMTYSIGAGYVETSYHANHSRDTDTTGVVLNIRREGGLFENGSRIHSSFILHMNINDVNSYVTLAFGITGKF